MAFFPVFNTANRKTQFKARKQTIKSLQGRDSEVENNHPLSYLGLLSSAPPARHSTFQVGNNGVAILPEVKQEVPSSLR